MSYQIQIDERSRVASRFISHVHRAIQAGFVAASRHGVTQQALATKLGVNRATVNKRLQGLDNLTLRSVAELAWALGGRPEFTIRFPEADSDRNETMSPPPVLAASSAQNRSVGAVYVSTGAQRDTSSRAELVS